MPLLYVRIYAAIATPPPPPPLPPTRMCLLRFLHLSFCTLPLPLSSPLLSYTKPMRAQASNATSWERPVKEDSSGQPTKASPSPLGAGGKSKHGGGGTTRGKAEGGGGAAPPPLPAGWTELKDPETGGVYFWNQVRRRTEPNADGTIPDCTSLCPSVKRCPPVSSHFLTLLPVVFVRRLAW